MLPSEILDHVRSILFPGILAAPVGIVLFAVIVILYIRNDERKKRDAETDQALAAARADDLKRHDPTVRGNRPYPRHDSPS